MNSTATPPRKSGIFYGWIALAGASLTIFIVGGSFVISFGALLPVISVEFDWSRAQVALALTLGILAFGLPSPFFGIAINKFGPRTSLIVGNAMAGLGLASVFLVQEVWHLYLCYILVGFGGGFGGYLAGTTLINNWFIRRRSLALGIFQACSGLAGFVFPPLATALISAMGWRSAWLVLAGLIILVPVTIGGGFMVKNMPEDMGLVPDGTSPNVYSGVENVAPHFREEAQQPKWNSLSVMKKPTAWILGGFAVANAFSTGILLTHQIAYFKDIGYDSMTAATTLSIMSAFGIVGSLGFGFLALRINVRYLASAAFMCRILAFVVLLTTEKLELLYIFTILMGLSYGSLTAALPMFVGSYYPRERYASVMGMVFPFQIISNAGAATLAGFIFDATSSYTPAFIAAISLSTVGLFLAFIARSPEPDEA